MVKNFANNIKVCVSGRPVVLTEKTITPTTTTTTTFCGDVKKCLQFNFNFNFIQFPFY